MSQFECSSRVVIPEEILGREIDLGQVTVTREMIAAYAEGVGDVVTLAGPMEEAPPTFCLTFRRDLTPDISLPPNVFSLYGGHDLEFHQPIRAGVTYHITARIADVYEKSGRSGALTVVVREATIRDERGDLAARIVERQMIRERPAQTT
jgi:acyl dehydratase